MLAVAAAVLGGVDAREDAGHEHETTPSLTD